MPLLKVGDRCYTSCPWSVGHRYDYVSTCEVRKVEIKWYEANAWDLESVGHWEIIYWIRTDVDNLGLKSTPRHSYRLGDDGREPDLFLTPKEVMDKNIEKFKDMVFKQADSIRKTMHQLGYSKEEQRKVLTS